MGSDVNRIQSLLLQEQHELEAAKDSRAQAKANGSYKNSPKNYRLSNGSKGTVHDNRVDCAQQLVKKYKAQLAEAKKAAKKK